MKATPEHLPLGLIGGTFDPVHFGHLRLAEEARLALNLACVRWIPAGQPPHRGAPAVTPDCRLDMVRLAIGSNPAFELDAAEVRSAAPSYTVVTLERLRTELGGERSLVLLLGADAFLGLPGWKRWREIFGLAHVAVASRPGFELSAAHMAAPLAQEFAARRLGNAAALAGAPAGGILSFPITPLGISATGIRELVGRNGSPRYLLPDPVLAYIQTHQLYC